MITSQHIHQEREKIESYAMVKKLKIRESHEFQLNTLWEEKSEH